MPDTAVPEAPARQRAAHEVALRLHRLGNEPPADLRHAEASAFARDQRRHADRMSIALEKQRFGFLGDVEAVHLRPVLHRPTLVRLMVSDDGTTVAAILAVGARPQGAVVRRLLAVAGLTAHHRHLDLVTAFGDGHHVVTDNGRGVRPEATWPAEVDVDHRAPSTAPAELLAAHTARVAAHVGSTRTQAVVVRDVATVARLWSARTAAINTHRRAHGYATEDELRGLLGKDHDRLAALVRQELALLTGADGV